MKLWIVLGCAALAATLWFLPAQSPPATPPAAPEAQPPPPQAEAPPAESQPASTSASARPDGRLEPLDVAPIDSLLVWKGLPDPELLPPTAGPEGIILSLTRHLFAGQIPPGMKFTMRLFEGFGEVIRHPFAVALVDASAENRDKKGDVEGSDFKIIIAVDETASEKVLKTIQAAISELTDASVATLSRREASGFSYQELDDKRLDWCKIAWGRMNNLFVVTFGRDVWPLAAATAAGEKPSVSRDRWASELRHKRAAAPPLIEILVNADGIRERLDPLVNRRASGFFEAWNAQSLRRMLWGIGFVDRALYCEAYMQDKERTHYRLYADAQMRDPRYVGLVPEEARYAVFDFSPGEVLSRLVGAVYSTRHAAHQRQIDKWWVRFQKEHGFDAERDILANLGDRLLVHNFPHHPLRIPLAVTLVVELKGDPAAAKKNIDLLCEQWQIALEEAAEATPVANAARLERQDNGIWFLAFGDFFKASAWIVTDKYFISSWSPWALEQYLGEMGEKLGAE